jgi:hypothetical protein
MEQAFTESHECNTIVAPVPQRKVKATTFRLDDDLWAGLQAVKERDGVPVGEQVRRGIRLWLDSKGIKPKGTQERADRQRARTRRRP